MKARFFSINLAVLSLLLLGADWTQFRSGDTTGVAAKPAPTSWNVQDGTNIAWQAELPGRGLSGPIVVNGRVIVTANTGFRQDRLHVLCYDVKSGAQLWHRQFWATGRTQCHAKMCMATPQPASDGKRIFAFYSCNDLFCLDLDGKLLWHRGLTFDYPNASNSLGMASSPIVVGGALIVQVENESESFAAGIDVEDGVSLWKIDRPKSVNWTTPAILKGKNPGEDLVVLQSAQGLTARNPRSGKEVWLHEASCSTKPSLAVSGNMLFVPSQGLTALRHNAQSAAPEIVWQASNLAPGTSSPVAFGGRVYTLGGSGLRCGDAQTGKRLWQLRLLNPKNQKPLNFSSTLVVAGSRLYVFSEQGVGLVVESDEKRGRIVGTSDLGETIMCTPAVADGAVYVRSDKHLWKIAESVR